MAGVSESIPLKYPPGVFSWRLSVMVLPCPALRCVVPEPPDGSAPPVTNISYNFLRTTSLKKIQFVPKKKKIKNNMNVVWVLFHHAFYIQTPVVSFFFPLALNPCQLTAGCHSALCKQRGWVGGGARLKYFRLCAHCVVRTCGTFFPVPV